MQTIVVGAVRRIFEQFIRGVRFRCQRGENIVKIDGDRLHGVRVLKNISMGSYFVFRYVPVFDKTGTDRKLTMRAFDRYRSRQKRAHIEKVMST